VIARTALLSHDVPKMKEAALCPSPPREAPMANILKRVEENIEGDFFVDATCIDCDTCRQIAPAVFGEGPDHAYVYRQPISGEDRRRALHALVSCPTGSIGSRGGNRPASVMDDFPLAVEEPVYYCGFNSPKSYGGNSYFVRHSEGNWLIDSPKFLPRLVRRFEQMGGIARIFLTHSDDVADAELYAERFGARRYIHQAELSAQPGAEEVLRGEEPIRLAEDFLAIPTPGHTKGHCVLLFRDRFLLTGDHLAWDRHERLLEAFHDYCWYSWPRQVESMRRLAEFRFEWVLPGHGQRVWLPADEMRRQMRELVGRMAKTGD
jgi:glyoxylase-like metal-dependent hydrolase (beta-lactamase superfamily II)/ferredoxin